MLPAFMRKYGATLSGATIISIPIIKRGAIDFAVTADWTPAAGDVRVRKDNGTWADIGTLPTVSGAGGNGSSAAWDFVLSNTELTAKRVDVMISDAATEAIEDQFFTVETFGHASAMYPSDPGADNTDAEARFILAAEGIIFGTVGSGTNNTTTVSISGGQGACDPTPTVTDQFKGQILKFLRNTATAALRGQGFPIAGNSTTAITCAAGDALTTAAAEGDKFVIV